jgi:tRNA(Ile2) C34 agmatinyltransferase TiaS
MSDHPHPPYLDFEDRKMEFPEKGDFFFLFASNLEQPLRQHPANQEPGIWLFRSEGGSCGMIIGNIPVMSNNRESQDLFMLHHNDQLVIQGVKARFVEIEKMVLEKGHHLVDRKCPLCHKKLEVGQVVVRCPLCGEGYCEACFIEIDGKQCCSRDCMYSPGPL